MAPQLATEQVSLLDLMEEEQITQEAEQITREVGV